MKPVTVADYPPGHDVQDSLLLLYTSKFRKDLRYVTQLLARNCASIRSKGGIVLPSELWAMVLNFARDALKEKFFLVKVDGVASASASNDTVHLRCVRYRFDCPADEVIAGTLGDDNSVYDFETFLRRGTLPPAGRLETDMIETDMIETDMIETEMPQTEMPELCRLAGPGNTFDVVLDNTSSTDPYLYAFRDVPDFIAMVDGGYCWVCNGEKFICPGCTGGKTQEFQVFMSCGVDLACPLCIGVQISQSHKAFLEGYLDETPPEDEAEDMRKLLEERLEELGYTGVTVPESAYGGAQNEFWQ
ncbi:hypothetical protein F4820DRAFT_437303 [Hypoxylon rubiginosum]|uniref:Uncharacterized protein n=1 Tax=Hypoxylon rubiginosum TaxID=110542 RepID=A0ACB9YMA0_9PEZI|nr:hypothetical protein F4820DRAFT_437303 [Hypoxylon rubiginosum]